MTQTLRALFINSPVFSGIDPTPEIERLSRRLNTVIVSDGLSFGKLFDICKYEEFDIIHFACHAVVDDEGCYSELLLDVDPSVTGDDIRTIRNAQASPSEHRRVRPLVQTLKRDQVLQLVKLSKAKLGFFNACNSAYIANYCVSLGLESAVFTTVDIPDSRAWEIPSLFYESLHRQSQSQTSISYRSAFSYAVSSNPDGRYGWAESPQKMSISDPERVLLKIEELTTRSNQHDGESQDLRTQLGALLSLVENIPSSIDSIRSDVQQLQSGFDKLEDSLASLERRIVQVENLEKIYPSMMPPWGWVLIVAAIMTVLIFGIYATRNIL